MPATPTINPTKAALEAAVLDLTDAQIADALRKIDPAVRAAYKDRETYTSPREAQRTLLQALTRRLAEGRTPATSCPPLPLSLRPGTGYSAPMRGDSVEVLVDTG